MSGSEDNKHSYFDVEKFRRVLAETSKPMGKWGRMFRRITASLDAMQGLFIFMLMTLLGLGVLGLVVVSAMLGPFGFLIIMGCTIGGVGLFVERKAGKSLQFGDYDFLRRTLATTIAFVMVIGALFVLLFLSQQVFSLLPHIFG